MGSKIWTWFFFKEEDTVSVREGMNLGDVEEDSHIPRHTWAALIRLSGLQNKDDIKLRGMVWEEESRKNFGVQLWWIW